MTDSRNEFLVSQYARHMQNNKSSTLNRENEKETSAMIIIDSLHELIASDFSGTILTLILFIKLLFSTRTSMVLIHS